MTATSALRLGTMAAVLSLTTACGFFGGKDDVTDGPQMRFSDDSVECMERAMFFESHRSSRDGLMAVGTVVMNRVASPDFPNTVCGVVGQRNQFAPGVMTRPMNSAAMPGVQAAARAVLAGERHPMVGGARFFHQKDHRFSYDNMHYVVTAGGNAFYEKRKSHLVTQPAPLPQTEGLTPL
ncbi:Cell Wall Hydrolase [Loktanella sp. DSM 29012]|uniref:cell wall hydrolase n=1 Tax=Loktanella sp. DSM 29012 TaxID=1881056 RepID=UPI0008B7B7C9|nr:Cell Wall Hydrolase [Loktanella sp. DSM 29012]